MSELGITPSQAHYVLSKMLGEKKITRREIAAYLGMMQKEIDALEKRLEELRMLKEGDEESAPATAASGAKARVARPTKKKRSKITAEQRASRQLQGVYMSMLRRIPKNKRKPYQTLAKEKDRQAAVDAMKAVLGI